MDKATVRIRLDGRCSILCKSKMLFVKELHIPQKGQVAQARHELEGTFLLGVGKKIAAY
jgi:hypothetical protein